MWRWTPMPCGLGLSLWSREPCKVQTRLCTLGYLFTTKARVHTRCDPFSANTVLRTGLWNQKTRLTNMLFDTVIGYWGGWQCNRIDKTLQCLFVLCLFYCVSGERACNLTCQMQCLRIQEKYVTWFQSCNPCNPAALLGYCIKSNYYSNYWFKFLVRGSHIFVVCQEEFDLSRCLFLRLYTSLLF